MLSPTSSCSHGQAECHIWTLCRSSSKYGLERAHISIMLEQIEQNIYIHPSITFVTLPLPRSFSSFLPIATLLLPFPLSYTYISPSLNIRLTIENVASVSGCASMYFSSSIDRYNSSSAVIRFHVDPIDQNNTMSDTTLCQFINTHLHVDWGLIPSYANQINSHYHIAFIIEKTYQGLPCYWIVPVQG